MDAIRRPPNDQAASDCLAAGLDPRADESARAIRRHATSACQRSAQESAGTAAQREIAGAQRDLEAHARDRAAELRDLQAQVRDELSDTLAEVGGRAPVSSGRDVIARAALDRRRAAEDRALAAEQRALAAQSREHAANDRLLSMRDRAAAVAEQQLAAADDLTGVLRRRAGVAMLRRELDRAHRTNSVLTAVFIAVDGLADVDGLAAVDDTEAQNAGDTVLCGVAGALLANMRSYDLVIRVGDQFVCALCDVTITDARTRFSAVAQTMARSGVTIELGCAELAANDTPTSLIDRAQAGLRATGARPDDNDPHRPSRRQHLERLPTTAATRAPIASLVATAVADPASPVHESPQSACRGVQARTRS